MSKYLYRGSEPSGTMFRVSKLAAREREGAGKEMS